MPRATSEPAAEHTGRRLIRDITGLRARLGLLTGLTTALAVTVVAQADLLAGALSGTSPWWGFAAAVAVRALVGWVRTTLAERAAVAATTQLRASLLAAIQRLGPVRLATRHGGGLTTLAGTGLDGLNPYVARYLPARIAAVAIPVCVLARLAVADWGAALTLLVIVPLVPIFGWLIGAHTQARTAHRWHVLESLGGHFLDAVAGLSTLRAFGRARVQADVVHRMASAFANTTMRTLRVAFLSALALELLATLSVALVAVPTGLRLLEGRTSLHTALLVLFLAPELYLPLRAFAAAYHDSALGIQVAGQVFEVLDEAPESADGTASARPRPRHAEPHAHEAAIHLNAVTVRYADRPQPALRALSLVVRHGEKVGLVGPSGAGKSTILAAILGFVTPDEGQVSIDGVALSELDAHTWRRRIAWVPQRPHLFTTSVADNIRLGNPAATLEDVEAAADAACAQAFINALPQGFHTPLGPNGFGLSAGQRQRIALARAFLKDAPVLLLDEPTAHLDSRTEAAVVEATARVMHGRTTLVVAHRTFALDGLDRVVSLTDGVLREPATPLAAVRF